MRTFSRKDLGTELAAERDAPRERTEELDDLGNVVVVLVVSRARMRVEQVVARQEFKELHQNNPSQALSSRVWSTQ